MADPLSGDQPRRQPPGPATRLAAAGIGAYASADLWRAVDELQAAARHITAAVELLGRAIDRAVPADRPCDQPIGRYPGALSASERQR